MKTPGMPRRGGGGGGIEPRYQLVTTLESPIAKSKGMGSSHITALLPSPHPRDVLEAPRPISHFQGRGVLIGCNASEGRGSKSKEGGSHIFSRLSRALHSRGSVPVSSFL